MLKHLKNRRAQAVMGEYMLVIFLVLAVIVSMTIYFKRLVQARIHDTRDYMFNEVIIRTAGDFDGNLYKEYEPYYTNVASTITSDVDQTTALVPSLPLSSGIYRKVVNEVTSVRSMSETAPPKEFRLTEPGP